MKRRSTRAIRKTLEMDRARKLAESAPKVTALFPGPKHEVRYGVLGLDDLRDQALSLAATLGPDHPQVKLLRKELADREATDL